MLEKIIGADDLMMSSGSYYICIEEEGRIELSNESSFYYEHNFLQVVPHNGVLYPLFIMNMNNSWSIELCSEINAHNTGSSYDVHGTSVEFFEFINSGVVTEDNFDELAFQYNTLMDVQCTSITMAYMCSRDVPESTFKFTCKPELVQFSIEEYKNIIVLLDSVLERLHSWVV